jgi:glucarate dehydratase
MKPPSIATEQPSAADPLAACLDPAATLVVAETALGAPALRQVVALARAVDVTLALRGANASALAAEYGCAVAGAAEEIAPPSGPALKVREIRLHRIALPLTDLYVSSMYLTDTQARTLVEIRTEQGLVGWGESHATALPKLQALAKTWVGRDLSRDLPALRRSFGRIGFDNRDGRNALSAFAGLELASWDLRAQAADQPLHRLLGHEGPVRPLPIACPLPAAVPGRKIDRTELAQHMADIGNAERVAELAAGFKTRFGLNAFKYKSAGNTPAWDLAALSALRRTLGPQARLRFDPNAAYSTHDALALCRQLEPLGLEFFEDPTDGLEGLARLGAHLKTPFATNMCIIAPEHLVAAYRRGLKVTVLGDVFLWGGVQGLGNMALAARAMEHRPAVHSFYESGVVTAANCHIALAFGMDSPHPMDCGTPGLAADLGAPFTIRDGHIHCPAGPGLGFTPNPAQLAALASADPIPIS